MHPCIFHKHKSMLPYTYNVSIMHINISQACMVHPTNSCTFLYNILMHIYSMFMHTDIYTPRYHIRLIWSRKEEKSKK